MKTIIIGDIHGCFEEFQKILLKADLSTDTDTLVLLGDLIDRGPDSYHVVKTVLSLKETMKERMIIIRGSHECLFLDHKTPCKNLLWNIAGKHTTIKSFKKNRDDLYNYSSIIEKNTVLWYETPLLQCTHAAVKYSPIKDNDLHTLTLDHFTAKRNHYNGKLTVTGHIHLNEPTYYDGNGGKGLTLSYEKDYPLPEKGVICIDTGCGNRGKLTCMTVSGKFFRLKCIR